MLSVALSGCFARPQNSRPDDRSEFRRAILDFEKKVSPEMPRAVKAALRLTVSQLHEMLDCCCVAWPIPASHAG